MRKWTISLDHREGPEFVRFGITFSPDDVIGALGAVKARRGA